MQVVDANGNMYGDDNLEINDVNGKPKTTGGGGATPLGYYGAWQDDLIQTAAASNTGYAMIYRVADITPSGISIVNNGSGNPTRITFANTGIYNIQFSSQFQNLANSPQDVTVWLRKNGTDVAGSSGVVGMEARKNPGDPYHTIVSWNYLLSVVAGEYYELVWSTTNHTNVEMHSYAAGSPPPSAASVILTVTQQSGIMAGTGITALNSLTGAAQTFGNDTNVTMVSSGTNHAITWAGTLDDSRIASASTWNAKQNKTVLQSIASTTIVTNNTNEVNIISVAIPTTIAYSMLRCSFTVRVVTLGAATPRTRIRMSTFPNPTTAQLTASTQLATNAIGSLGMVSIYRTMPVIGGVSGTIKAFATGSNANADYGQLAAFDLISKDFTTQQYLHFTIQNNTLTANTQSYGVLVENL